MASFSRYKSEGLINEISTNVAITCLLSLCDCSLVIWCHSVYAISGDILNRRPISKRERR